MNKERKKLYGQFYTVNYKYILTNMYIPNIPNSNLIEPFAGEGHLIDFINSNNVDEKLNYIIECYDIDPKKDFIIKRDTLLNPPIYHNKFVITNPPYLARNKTENKLIYDKYGQNDLYKCFIINLIEDICLGGILILPINFLCSIRMADINLRKKFMKSYNIQQINIFEEKVFSDTTNAVCSLQFEQIKSNEIKSSKIKSNEDIRCVIYPSGVNLSNICFNKSNNYTIGGEIYLLKQDTSITIDRLTIKNKDGNRPYTTNINVRCIDNNVVDCISAYYVDDDDLYIDDTDKSSARTFMTLLIKPKISKETQIKLVDDFNKYLCDMRIKYNSLFLTNYRESKNGVSRKRISFGLVFKIMNYLLSN